MFVVQYRANGNFVVALPKIHLREYAVLSLCKTSPLITTTTILSFSCLICVATVPTVSSIPCLLARRWVRQPSRKKRRPEFTRKELEVRE